jgi:hypothetical protein
MVLPETPGGLRLRRLFAEILEKELQRARVLERAQ